MAIRSGDAMCIIMKYAANKLLPFFIDDDISFAFHSANTQLASMKHLSNRMIQSRSLSATGFAAESACGYHGAIFLQDSIESFEPKLTGSRLRHESV